MNAVFSETGSRSSSPTRQLTALIVDDDEQVMRLLRRIFGQCRYAVDTACTCREGLGKAATSTYDLAMVDVNLTDGNGLDLIEPIRKFSPNVEIISITGEDPLAHKAAERKQVDYHLVKPVDFKELISVLLHIARKIKSLSPEPMPANLRVHPE